MELIAEQLTNDLSTLAQYQSRLGDSGEVRIFMNSPVGVDQLQQIQDYITSQGGVLTDNVSQDAGMLVIPFENKSTGIGALPILLIVAGAAVLIVGSVIGWQIFTTSKAGVPVWVWGVIGVALIYLFMTSDTGKKATGLAISAGKMYVTKGALKNPRRKQHGKR